MKKIFFPLFLILIFIMAVGVWVSPILFRGYPVSLRSVEVVLARNLAQSGVYGSENDLNVVVAPELVKSQANYSSQGDKFSPYFWSLVFRAFGAMDWNHLIAISLIINALALVFFTITARVLFGPKAGYIFPFIYILLPSNWQTAATSLGVYEFSLLFFSLFTWFYFWGRDQKCRYVFLVLSGLFLVLSCLARETMFLFVPVFFFWLIFLKKKKELMMVFAPFVVMLVVFWLPTILGFNGVNHYRNFFVVSSNVTENHYSDYHSFGQFYRDPYTFHFNKEAAESQYEQDLENKENNLFYRASLIKNGADNAIRQPTFFERLRGGTIILSKHLLRFFSIESAGGPLILLLALVGLFWLKQKDKKIFYLFGVWLLAVPVLLGYAVLATRNHLVDLGFALAGLISLGLVVIWQLISRKLGGRRAKALFIILVLFVLYDLFLAGRIFWGQAYDSSNTPQIRYLAQKTNEVSGLGPEDVIAGGCACFQPTLNYLTNKSVIFFHPDTIKELAEKKELQSAFDQFGIKYFIGYDAQVSELITGNTQAKNIADWPQRAEVDSFIGHGKSWLLNLIR